MSQFNGENSVNLKYRIFHYICYPIKILR